MAGRKGTIENADFLSQITANSKNTAKSVSKTLHKISVSEALNEGKKKIEYIDVFQMDAAPSDWNKYPLLKESQPDKYLELKMSIYEKGVEDPLVLWEKGDKRYMILAGHNRQNVCKDIIEECKGEKDFNEEKYRMVPCIVYQEDDLDEDGAMEIIDDTNLYRDFSKLPEKIRMDILTSRMKLYKKRHYARGERIDQLAREFGMKKTAIYEVIALNENVIEPLKDLYFNGVIKKKSVLRFTSFSKDLQQWIFDNYGAKINDAKTNALKKNMTKAEITEVFDAAEKGVKKITVEIPEDRVEEFRDMVKEWIQNNR